MQVKYVDDASNIRNLISLDTLSKSDPFVVVYILDPLVSPNYEEIGQTETIKFVSHLCIQFLETTPILNLRNLSKRRISLNETRN